MSRAEAPPATAPVLRMLAQQTRTGFLSLWRVPAFSISGLALPVMFFAFFGLPNVGRHIGGADAGSYLLASFGAYAVSSMMVFNFGISVAQERAGKLDVLMRATPLPPAVYLGAKLVTALAFGLVALVILFLFAAVAGGVRLGGSTWATLAVRLLLGCVPFIGLGFAIGYGVSANAAPAVANLVYLPLSFASGLFLPVSQLPDAVQRLAPLLPTYHYGQLAWSAVGAGNESLGRSAAWLAGWSVLLFALALRAYRRDQARKFS